MIVATCSYDGEGRILECTDLESREYGRHRYDAAGRRIETRIPVKKEENEQFYQLKTYHYDACSNLTEVRRYEEYQTEDSFSGRYNSIRYHYNRSNLLVSVEDNTGGRICYEYNPSHKLIRETSLISEEETAEKRYVCDHNGRLTDYYEKLEQDAEGRDVELPYAHTSYQYDGNGNLTKITLPEGSTIRYEYDRADRCILERHFGKNDDIDNTLTYTYNHADQLASRKNGNGGMEYFAYDLMDRQISHTYPDGGGGTDMTKSYFASVPTPWQDSSKANHAVTYYTREERL